MLLIALKQVANGGRKFGESGLGRTGLPLEVFGRNPHDSKLIILLMLKGSKSKLKIKIYEIISFFL